MPFLPPDDPRERPLYAVQEAARYLKVRPSTLRAWCIGRPGGPEPVVRLRPNQDGRLSFHNLVEAYVLTALRRDHDASMAQIRRAIDYAEERLGVERLLLREELRTGAGDLFWDELHHLVNLSRSGQLVLRKVVAQYLQRIDRDPAHLPLKLYPFIPTRDARQVAIDARVAFGQPTLANTGIPTAIVRERVDAGEEPADLAADYGVTPDLIDAALLYEQAA